ncbi:MAG: ParB/RepB/Spo0J family partition protein [Nitrospinales bacterium]
MNYKYDCVALDSIDTTNSFYRITTTQDKTAIDDSVHRIGLICPVVLKEVNRHLVIISGFRRVETCQQLAWQEIPCWILPDDTPPVQCAELAITANLSQRPLNIVEQARCLQLFTKASDGPNVSMTMAKALGISLNRAFISKLKTILSTTQIIQDGLILGTLSLPIALLLSDLSNDDGDTVAMLFNKIPMGMNKQREVLLHLTEISARDDIPLKRLLEEDTIQNTLNSDLDGNQQSRKIRSYLKKRRYPRLVSVEERFHEQVGELGLNGAIQVMPPANFEGSSYTLAIRFDSLNALTRAHRKLSDAINNPIASQLFGSS